MWNRPRETGVKLDPKIEAFANYRDHIHRNFKFTPKNTLYAFVFVGVLPYFFYSKFKQDQMRRQIANGTNYPVVNTTFNGESDESKMTLPQKHF